MPADTRYSMLKVSKVEAALSPTPMTSMAKDTAGHWASTAISVSGNDMGRTTPIAWSAARRCRRTAKAATPAAIAAMATAIGWYALNTTSIG